MTSPTAPSVTHRWKSLDTFATEVSNARVSAGFRYRVSTRVSSDVGSGSANVVQSVIQPMGRVGSK